jgi:hypothetical protein
VFLFYLLLHLLSIGEPVALQRGKYFYVFSQNGVEMCNGNSAEWTFHFEGKLWALSDSYQDGISLCPCPSFQRFSRQKRAYIVQTTSPEDGSWKRWSNVCNAGLFIMECFTEKEAKALRSVIIASILFILFDLFSQ